MKFLEKIGLKKKKKSDEEEVHTPKPKPIMGDRLNNAIRILNQPMGGGIGFNHDPQRTLRERQLGIPEYVPPRDRAPNFIPRPGYIPPAKKFVNNWRPTPGKPSRNGKEVKW